MKNQNITYKQTETASIYNENIGYARDSYLFFSPNTYLKTESDSLLLINYQTKQVNGYTCN